MLLAASLATHGAIAADVFDDNAFATYQGDVKNGAYLANAAGCIGCHASGEDTSLLSGGRKLESHIGTFFVPNITASSQGTGGWTNAQYLNAVINGLAPDGRNYYPTFPYAAYAGMKPEDVLDIKAYIETLAQSDTPSERHEVSFPYNLDTTVSLWKRQNFETPAFQPGDGSQMSRGRYLVENVGACGECHTPRTLTYGLDQDLSLTGEKTINGELAPDISTARMSGLAHPEVFTRDFIDKGMKLSGSGISSPLKRNLAKGLSVLTDEDRLAMLAYLTGREQKVEKVEMSSEASCRATGDTTAVPTDNLALQADEFVGRYCRNCHGLGESAQGSFPAGELASIARNPAFVTPGDRSKSLLYTSVSSGRMPYGNSPSDAELEALGAWIDNLNSTAVAAEPAPPARSRPMRHWRKEAELALRDLAEVDERDRPFTRYYSFMNLYNGVNPCEEEDAFARRLDLFQAGFRKLINSVSQGPRLVMPTVVDGSDNLLVRVDIRDLKWDPERWQTLSATYPYGYAPGNDPSLEALANGTRADLPIMRADWFMANASRPEMYHMLLSLPENIEDLEQAMGVDVNRNIERLDVARAAFLEGSSGVSDHNRMLERHDLPGGGYYWKSYDFAGSRGVQSLKLHPHGPDAVSPLHDGLEPFEHDGGEMLFTLPNGMQGYYLSTAAGDRLDRGPTSIVSFRQRPIGKGIDIINGRSCMSCHYDGIIAKRDQLRSHLETSALFSLDQRDTLLRMYVEQKELDALYAKDRAFFIDALTKIDAVETAPDGTIRSRSGPGKEEVMTWFADFYEADMDAEMLAAEFEMTLDEFQQAIQRVQDPMARGLAIDWINQLQAGVRVPRFEMEEQFSRLIKPVLNLDPMDHHAGSASHANALPPSYKDASYRDDGYKPAGDPQSALKLRVHIDRTDVAVGEELTFSVTANNACELQIFYVEADGNVEVIPDEMIGDPFLQPGEPRLIPDKSVGALIFDTPANDETLVLNCREGGLRDQRLSAHEARSVVRASRQPPSRGLAVKLFEKNKAQAASAAKTTSHSQPARQTSAVHMVTFNVLDH
ncbi:c-type cytochrome [Roseibium suaedae]|uniref:Cytochrome c domain-containing protein n=1 Tax=Roseibium suaedae TaxID=735517 RepID=A0A1M6YWC3_9HYPH|nr:c-type cytochrome [Roseibium suaedae]SHL22591.1 protein of unknown function [Roseibium suaedae]